MKKRILLVVLIISVISSMIVGCSTISKSENITEEPDIKQIRSICELATLECYYHNVAKSEKKPGKGITHIGEKTIKFWVEYDGVVKLGIDMSKVKLSVDGEKIKITIPEAKVMSVKVNQDSYNDDSYYFSKGGFNKNKVTAEDATKAVNEAENEMMNTAQSNSALLISAQNRAKQLIENYIKQIGDATGVKYKLKWEYISD